MKCEHVCDGKAVGERQRRLRVFCFDSFYNERDAQPAHAALIDTMRALLALLLLLVAASLAAADYPVPIYSHTGTVIQPPHIPRCMLCICPHTPRVMQPYDNGFYVATQARAHPKVPLGEWFLPVPQPFARHLAEALR